MTILTMISKMSEGLGRTCAIFFLTLLFALPLGLLVSLLRMSKNKVISSIMKVYISVLRGTPLMLQLLAVTYGPYYLFGINVSREKLIPVVLSKDTERMTMRELSGIANMNVQKFYRMIMANIYKSPRALARKMMLSKAATMLESSDKSIQEIADACGFATPNYFIAMFYHQMKTTPERYRSRKSKYSA